MDSAVRRISRTISGADDPRHWGAGVHARTRAAGIFKTAAATVSCHFSVSSSRGRILIPALEERRNRTAAFREEEDQIFGRYYYESVITRRLKYESHEVFPPRRKQSGRTTILRAFVEVADMLYLFIDASVSMNFLLASQTCSINQNTSVVRQSRRISPPQLLSILPQADKSDSWLKCCRSPSREDASITRAPDSIRHRVRRPCGPLEAPPTRRERSTRRARIVTSPRAIAPIDRCRGARIAVLPGRHVQAARWIAARLSRATTLRSDLQSGQDCRHLPAICRRCGLPVGRRSSARSALITRCTNTRRNRARSRCTRWASNTVTRGGLAEVGRQRRGNYERKYTAM